MVGERLLPSPRNAVRAPFGKDRKRGRPGAGRLAVARLEWSSGTWIVPVTLVWISTDRVCVEWAPRPGGQARMTWLPRADVRARLVY